MKIEITKEDLKDIVSPEYLTEILAEGTKTPRSGPAGVFMEKNISESYLPISRFMFERTYPLLHFNRGSDRVKEKNAKFFIFKPAVPHGGFSRVSRKGVDR